MFLAAQEACRDGAVNRLYAQLEKTLLTLWSGKKWSLLVCLHVGVFACVGVLVCLCVCMLTCWRVDMLKLLQCLQC